MDNYSVVRAPAGCCGDGFLLADQEEAIARNFTERLMAFALGRQLEGYDEIVVDELMPKIAEDKYRMRGIVLEVVGSYLFTHRRVM